MIKLITLYRLNSFLTISSGFILFITAVINSGLLITSFSITELEYFFITISIFNLITILYANTLRSLSKKSIKEFFLKGPFSIIYLLYQITINSYEIITPDSMEWLVMSANGAYVFIGIRFIIEGSSQLHRYAERINTSATELTLISFFLIIMIGAFLLMLPGATTDNKGASFIDALFTSTSAVCVTGLIVVDTAKYFTQFGQLIIMLLVQVGGLGIMTLAAFFTMLSGRGMNLREKIILRDQINANEVISIFNMLTKIILITFIIELLGAISFFIFMYESSQSIDYQMFAAMFHSVASFCNAGFALFTDNLVSYNTNYGVSITVMVLIILGGIGFYVISDLLRKTIYVIKRRKMKHRLSVQTKLVLIVTAILIVGGTVAMYFIEQDKILKGYDFGEQILISAFQSVTTRTAGFNSVDIGALSSSVLFGFMLLMFIGASSGSTGGGIKTNTFAILFLKSIQVARGSSRFQIYKRSISNEIVDRAMVVFFFSSALVALMTIVILIIEPFTLEQIMFEVISAFGTVGLSTGITPKLSWWGKFLIIITMYIGRVGPLTVALIISESGTKYRYDYPSENVMIG